MDYERKYKYTLIGLIVMVVVNIGMLASIWMIRPPQDAVQTGGETTPPVQRFLEHELELDQQQRRELRNLRRQHFRQARPIMEGIRAQRQRFTELLQSSDSLGARQQMDSLAARIGQLQSRLEQQNYRHFRQIRRHLNRQQRQQFDTIIDQAMRRQGHGRRGGPGPGMRGGGGK